MNIKFSDPGYSALRLILGSVIKLIWVRAVAGKENIPKDRAVIVALNHQSYFDFLCFAAIAPKNIYFLAAEKFFESWRWRTLMGITGQIRVDRNSKDKTVAHNNVVDYLASGKIIGIFPEGTRSPHKNEMLPAYTGAVKYALMSRVDIIPAGIVGTYEVMSRHDKLPRFKKVVSINVGEAINLSAFYGKTLSREEHEELIDHVMLRISELSGKSYSRPNNSADF